MLIKTQAELIEATWINCNRISALGNISLYFITCGGQAIPSFYMRLLNKHFESSEGYNSFFAETNKPKNYPKFIKMLNESGGFTVHDILLLGPLAQRQQLDHIPVEEIKYAG